MRYDAVLHYADEEHRSYATYLLPSIPPAAPVLGEAARVRRQGVRQPIFGDDSFNDDAGVIACRQMGLPSTDVRIMVGGSGSGEAFSVPGSGQIWLDGVDCSSTDPKRLEDCNHK